MKRLTLIAFVFALVTAQVRSQSTSPRVDPPNAIRSMLDKYCVGCHSSSARAGGVAFADLSLDAVGDNAEIWEKAVRKLRGRLMPPPGSRQPDQAEVDACISSLEDSLDNNAARPVAGHVLTQRMTPTEYGIAVKDLLGVEIDAENLLRTEIAVSGLDTT